MAVVACLCFGALAACSATSGGGPSSPPPSTITETIHSTRTPTDSPTFAAKADTTVRPLPPGTGTGPAEVEKRCPYIRTGLNQDGGAGGVNLADIEGDRVYRTTVIAGDTPDGCRFYFYAPPYEAVAEIRPRTFATATAAHNALVLTARGGVEQISEPGFVRGADGILYRTRFFGPDDRSDWAFAFAKGKVLVVIRTQRSDTSRNALYLGQAIAGKF